MLLRRWMVFQLEPVPALAALWLSLVQPHPVDVRVALVADATDAPEAVERVYDVGLLARALAALASLHEERIV